MSSQTNGNYQVERDGCRCLQAGLAGTLPAGEGKQGPPGTGAGEVMVPGKTQLKLAAAAGYVGLHSWAAQDWEEGAQSLPGTETSLSVFWLLMQNRCPTDLHCGTGQLRSFAIQKRDHSVEALPEHLNCDSKLIVTLVEQKSSTKKRDWRPSSQQLRSSNWRHTSSATTSVDASRGLRRPVDLSSVCAYRQRNNTGFVNAADLRLPGGSRYSVHQPVPCRPSA